MFQRNKDQKGGVPHMSESYSFLHIQKIKSFGTIASKYNHNCRTVDVKNADPSAREKNETLIALPEVDGKELDYVQAYNKRMEKNPDIQRRGYRADAVLAYEIVLTYTDQKSSGQAVDVEKWKERTTEWLKDYFNIAGDGKDNVLHAVFHADEAGNHHIHAFVSPVDPRGKLCAKSFTGGSRMMSEMQSSYAEAIEDLGIERGITGSSARHEDIRRLYTQLNNTLADVRERIPEVPQQMQGEDIHDYADRLSDYVSTLHDVQHELSEQMQDQSAAHLRHRHEQATRIRQDTDQELFQTRNEISKGKRELKTMDETRTEIAEQIDSFSKQRDILQLQLQELQNEIDRTPGAKDAVKFYRDLQRGIDKIAKQDPERAETLRADISQALQTDHSRTHVPELGI